ncbi:hypothetical protein [Shimia marina]|uniref:Uncharacterized protein n=1 Tax=Shimia marina TaxID=321267 RepID=A0A0P1EQH9_9RHOB|nr:hypothetical protein [Shimia marina]CUH52672.1 hypothetical protein SHM7688_02119 [Shimia marina]SFE74974.1 hypothetical protein SAMN04488037_1194 [Shimia marina]
MNLMQDAPNVVSEDGLRMLLAEGHSADVVCRATPTKTSAQWSGVWTVHCVSPDGEIRRLLVTSRNNMVAREFKTINGLVSFLAGVGLTTASIPMLEGKVASHRLDNNS